MRSYFADLVARRPVVSFLFLSYAISWSVWFTIPLYSGGDWTIIKLFVAAALGPGLAAVLLDRMRGTAGAFDRTWWVRFVVITAVVAALNASSLLTGDARSAAEFASVQAPGFTPVGLIGALLGAAVCGFVFASAAGSRAPSMRSIIEWRKPLRWWLVAAFLPAALLVISYVFARVTGEALPDDVAAGLPLNVWVPFVSRALVFTLVVIGIGEETGWRGWMLPELQRRYSPLVSSIIIGVLWGFWHFPLFLVGAYPGPADAVVEYIFLGPLIALLFTWLFNRTQSVLLAMVLHAAINNSQRLLPTTTLFPVLLVAFLVFVIVKDRMWRRPFASGRRPERDADRAAEISRDLSPGSP